MFYYCMLKGTGNIWEGALLDCRESDGSVCRDSRVGREAGEGVRD